MDGLVDGMEEPLRVAVTYRFPNPRITTYLPPWTDTPGTRIIDAATSVSPNRANSSTPSVSTILPVSRSLTSKALGSKEPITTTSSICGMATENSIASLGSRMVAARVAPAKIRTSTRCPSTRAVYAPRGALTDTVPSASVLYTPPPFDSMTTDPVTGLPSLITLMIRSPSALPRRSAAVSRLE